MRKSRVAALFRSIGAVAVAAKTIGAGATVIRWGRSSWLYGWVVTDPDPSAMVVDLRTTRTLGPLLSSIGAVVGRLRPAVRSSRFAGTIAVLRVRSREAPIRVGSGALLGVLLASVLVGAVLGSLTTTGVIVGLCLGGLCLVGLRVRTPWGRFAETRPVQLLVALLEPPAPPEEHHPTRAVSDEGASEG